MNKICTVEYSDGVAHAETTVETLDAAKDFVRGKVAERFHGSPSVTFEAQGANGVGENEWLAFVAYPIKDDSPHQVAYICEEEA